MATNGQADKPTVQALASAAHKKGLDDLAELFRFSRNVVAMVRSRCDEVDALIGKQESDYKTTLDAIAEQTVKSVDGLKNLLGSLQAAEDILQETPRPPVVREESAS
jgi:hypothetical protein